MQVAWIYTSAIYDHWQNSFHLLNSFIVKKFRLIFKPARNIDLIVKSRSNWLTRRQNYGITPLSSAWGKVLWNTLKSHDFNFQEGQIRWNSLNSEIQGWQMPPFLYRHCIISLCRSSIYDFLKNKRIHRAWHHF